MTEETIQITRKGIDGLYDTIFAADAVVAAIRELKFGTIEALLKIEDATDTERLVKLIKALDTYEKSR